MTGFDEKYCIESFQKLLETDSPTGLYEEMQEKICGMIEELGYPCEITYQGGVIADLGGEGDPLVLTAHLDCIGLMVSQVLLL